MNKKIETKRIEITREAAVEFLKKHKLQFEDSSDKFKISPTFGKKQPLIVRAFEASVMGVWNFVGDVVTATKAILREIL